MTFSNTGFAVRLFLLLRFRALCCTFNLEDLLKLHHLLLPVFDALRVRLFREHLLLLLDLLFLVLQLRLLAIQLLLAAVEDLFQHRLRAKAVFRLHDRALDVDHRNLRGPVATASCSGVGVGGARGECPHGEGEGGGGSDHGQTAERIHCAGRNLNGSPKVKELRDPPALLSPARSRIMWLLDAEGPPTLVHTRGGAGALRSIHTCPGSVQVLHAVCCGPFSRGEIARP